jgi:hypothetical protein
MQINGVAGQWSLGLSLGGLDYPASITNVPKFEVYETIHQSLPSLNLEIKDYTGDYIKSTASGDGTLVEAVYGDGVNNNSATFMIQGNPSVRHEKGCSILSINAVLNHVNYLRRTALGSFKGSSSSVISKIASNVGLTPVTTSSADSQQWLPNNKSFADFAKSIKEHGWASESSLMMLAVSTQGELIYGNAEDLAKQDIVKFGVDEKNSIIIEDWSGTSNGLLSGASRGYAATTVTYDQKGVVQEFNAAKSSALGNILSFGSSVGTLLEGAVGGLVLVRPRSSGNTHENYIKAEHQNARQRALYNIDLNLLVNKVSGAKLLRGAYAEPPNYGAPEISKVYTGNYLVTAKTTTFQSQQYCERITLTTNSVGG